MISSESKKYEAIIIDTSIFDAYGLKLDDGLLRKLRQFKNSKFTFILPDVMIPEIQRHLERVIKISRAYSDLAFNNNGDYFFYDDSELFEAQLVLVDSPEVKEIAENSIKHFIKNSGALVLECSNYVSISELLQCYLQDKPPFTGLDNSNEKFPDAVALLATDVWAQENDVQVLAVTKNGNWKNYCETSLHIYCLENFADALSRFNKEAVPCSFLSQLISNMEKQEDKGGSFFSKIRDGVESCFSNFSPFQKSVSSYYWEADGCRGWLKYFSLTDSNFKVVDHNSDNVVLKINANINLEVEGNFSLSQFDPIERNHTYIGSVTVTVEEEFTSEILITVSGNLAGDISSLNVDQVEVVDPITSVHFGMLEPDYSEYN